MMDTMTVPTSTTVGSGSNVSSKTEQFLKGIGATISKRKPCLSPIRHRPESSLAHQMKAPMSTGCLKPNKISFGEVKTLVFEKEIDGQDKDHKNAVWYSKQEIDSIRKDLKKSIRKGELTRGLEQYEEDFGVKTKQKRMNHVYTILELQRQQQQKGVYDDEGFQLLSRAMSADHIAKARRLASMDSTDAFHEYQTTNNHIIRTSSRNALDNLRKTLSVNVDGKRKGSSKSNNNIRLFGYGATTAGNQGGTAGKNASFGMVRTKSSSDNLLLQFMANKAKEKKAASAPVETGIA